ncbi:hypothetical protein BsWGS_04569 [Bradybaena similaris]
MDFVDVVEDKLSVEDISEMVSSSSCGAVSMFIGTTRDNFDGKQVLRLDYEAYMPMAKRKMLEICASIRKQWDVHSIAIIHRIGIVPVKEASIVIAISSPHRKESLEAVHFAIDTVKAIVPIWKKEIYSDEASVWKHNKECAWTNEVPTNAAVEHSESASVDLLPDEHASKIASSLVANKL